MSTLTDIEMRLAAITPGEWIAWHCRDKHVGTKDYYGREQTHIHSPACRGVTANGTTVSMWSEADDQFVAAAPADIRWLVAKYKNWDSIVKQDCEDEAELRALLVAAGIEDTSDSYGVEPVSDMVARLVARCRELEAEHERFKSLLGEGR